MNNLKSISEYFKISPDAVSVKLFFAKQTFFDTVWHICDASLCYEGEGNKVIFQALDGHTLYPSVRADTVLQADLQSRASDSLCQRCLEEFELAFAFIEADDQTQFFLDYD